MCENLPYESVYFKELHNEQECYRPTIHRAGAAVVSTIIMVCVLDSILKLGKFHGGVCRFQKDLNNRIY